MDALYLSTEAHDDARLYIAPLTRKAIASLGANLADAAGYFLYQRPKDAPERIEILARVPSEEAALKLAELLKLR